jgi:hypothetical protein
VLGVSIFEASAGGLFIPAAFSAMAGHMQPFVPGFLLSFLSPVRLRMHKVLVLPVDH